jgi:hypothetical protein
MRPNRLTAALLILAPTVAAAAIQAGQYEGLLIAVGPDGRVSGFYREQQGDSPTKTCQFFLSGRDDTVENLPVLTWEKQVLPGTLTPHANSVTLAIPHGSNHPGCALVLPPLIETGLDLTLTDPAPIQQLVRIEASRVPLRTKPSETAPRSDNLSTGAVAGVLGRSGPWLHVQYRNDQGKTKNGWIKADQTREPVPPN